MLNYSYLDLKMLTKTMITKPFLHFLSKITIFAVIILMINQCGIYRKTDARKVPTNAQERVKKTLKKEKESNLVVLEIKALENLNLPHLTKCGELRSTS